METPAIDQYVVGEAEQEGFSVDYGTKQKKRFSDEDIQSSVKRLRTDMCQDESSDLGLFKAAEVRVAAQEDAGNAFDAARSTA